MILSGIAIALAVVLVSGASVAGYAVWQLSTNIKPGVDISFAGGAAPPAVGPIQGPVNILLVGSDSGGGDVGNFGKRGENLNDVTMLLHISPVSHTAIAVSFPRDMYVPISGCAHSPGTRKINEALTNGGLACAVSTVSALTGLDIGYAAEIQFQGVIGLVSTSWLLTLRIRALRKSCWLLIREVSLPPLMPWRLRKNCSASKPCSVCSPAERLNEICRS